MWRAVSRLISHSAACMVHMVILHDVDVDPCLSQTVVPCVVSKLGMRG